MESSLHKGLKDHYSGGRDERSEVAVAGYRIDAVDDEGTLVEVQSGPLGALKSKLRALLPEHRVRIVKPVVLRRRLVRCDRAGGAVRSIRQSPKHGALVDVFDDLVGIAALLSEPNLRIEILGVSIEELRITRRRRPGYRIVDRRLHDVLERQELNEPADLWDLLPTDWPPSEPFTTGDLARGLNRPLGFAQRIAYCLRLSGAVQPVGKVGNSHLYKAEMSLLPS